MQLVTKYFKLLRMALVKWNRDKAVRIASSLAFFTGLALAPLLLFAVTVAGFFYRGEAAQQILYAEVRSNIGESAESLVREAITGLSEQQNEGLVATAVGVVILLFSASNLFWQMQDGFNTIWSVPAEDVTGVRYLIVGRLRSLVMVLLVGLLLLVVVVVSTTTNSVQVALEEALPFVAYSFPLINLAISLTLLTLIFAAVYHQMPRTDVTWRDVWFGAIVAAVLFELGETALTFYFRTASVGSVYGAAGTLLVILIWVFYTMQIILYGGEITYVYAVEHGSRRNLIKEPGLLGDRMPERVEPLQRQPLPPPNSSGLSLAQIIAAIAGFVIGIIVGSRDGRS